MRLCIPATSHAHDLEQMSWGRIFPLSSSVWHSTIRSSCIMKRAKSPEGQSSRVDRVTLDPLPTQICSARVYRVHWRIFVHDLDGLAKQCMMPKLEPALTATFSSHLKTARRPIDSALERTLSDETFNGTLPDISCAPTEAIAWNPKACSRSQPLAFRSHMADLRARWPWHQGARDFFAKC